jgi:hypothetical protein
MLIKILGSQTAFLFEVNLFEAQTCLENCGKFPKILTSLAFLNVNLDWHGYMAKPVVSILAPFDLACK